MCPNCILNQQGLSSGLYVAFGICGLFFVIAIAGIIWAFRNGEFEDMESVKFDMLDDDESSVLANRARQAMERNRLAANE
ncbi:MAG: cbb3-type cytochrome oxidase assembly protein [Candidatus Melainabacteria bacterium]|jgi:nitrogen fixation-related uncharacterized protein|nr:cbb3-type cytochrome oxidase assembly protein [Candidatus Melainabacteria bacterium]